jgi:DNA-binding response OmpR family regulator
MRGLIQSVVAVSSDPRRAELLDALVTDGNDFGVVVVESIARAYSRIKRLTPDLVIVFCELDDTAACQLLSMLKNDGDLSGVLVVTCASRRLSCGCEAVVSEVFEQSRYPACAIQMN